MRRTTSFGTWVVAGSVITPAFQTSAPSPYLGQPVPGLSPALLPLVRKHAVQLDRIRADDSASGTITAGDVYWMDARFLERFRK